jgi:hypothetical protein
MAVRVTAVRYGHRRRGGTDHLWAPTTWAAEGDQYRLAGDARADPLIDHRVELARRGHVPSRRSPRVVGSKRMRENRTSHPGPVGDWASKPKLTGPGPPSRK